jgi:hypothetical protein
VCVFGGGGRDELGRENGISVERGGRGLTMVQINTVGRLARFCRLQ